MSNFSISPNESGVALDKSTSHVITVKFDGNNYLEGPI